MPAGSILHDPAEAMSREMRARANPSTLSGSGLNVMGTRWAARATHTKAAIAAPSIFSLAKWPPGIAAAPSRAPPESTPSAGAEGQRLEEQASAEPTVAGADRAEDADRRSAIREGPRLGRMDAESDEDADEDRDPIGHHAHGCGRLPEGRGQIVPGGPADPGPEDHVRETLVLRRTAMDVGRDQARPAHVDARLKSVEEAQHLPRVRRPDADRVVIGWPESRQEPGHREVDEQFVVRHRFRAEDAGDPDERNARDEGADDRHRVAGHQSESSREGLARQAELAAAHGAGDARGPFQSEEGVVVHPAHDDGVALEDAEAEDLRAHRDRPVGRRQIRREAGVDRQGPRALRDREGVAREDAGGHAREGREDRPRGPQEERAEGQARERPRPDHVGRASFVRRSAGARREGTRPAKTAARRATASVRPIASIGRARITRFGRPKSGAKATTAWDNRMPSAAPRMVPAKVSRTAWASYTAAIVVGEAATP